ncbi:discoidin-2-like [Pecten maximus]|uniref:discoidin-2-like n=1 Tax=Pecten maximus TaxID=6579 RepID=UPI001458CC21|nr:discoidin-2-like [Pecten maximus]
MKIVIQTITILSTVTLCGAGCSPCDFDLVTGPYGVSDDALTASSTHGSCPIQRVRFSSSHGWCPAYTGDGHYIQVEFLAVSTLKAIQTRGRGDHNQWVTLYSVNTSMDGLNWSSILNATGSIKVFPGNVDRNTVVTNTLEGNVVAKYIRIISVSGTSYRSMRLEVKGCPVANVSSTCHKWEARQGSTGDGFSVLVDTDASNQGLCGLKCYRQSECDSFIYDVNSFRCRLLKTSPDSSYITVNLDGVWYFTKK